MLAAAGLAVSLTVQVLPSRAAETTCAASDATSAQLKSPLVKSTDDAVVLTKSYFSLATAQRDMFDKRKYAFDVVRQGDAWVTSIIFMRRPRYPWDDWKRRGRVGRVAVCSYDGRLISLEATY